MSDDLTQLDEAGLDALIADLDALAETKAANYGARAGQTIAGALGRDANGYFIRVGAGDASDSRVLGEARRGAAQLRRGAGGRGKGKGRGKGGAARKPKLTAEERAAQRQQEQAQNRAAVFGKLGVGQDIADGLAALERGDDPQNADALIAAGLATRGADGSVRATPQARHLLAAATRGDAGGARDALSLAKDRAAAAAEREKRKGKGGGGGGKGKEKKPTATEQLATNRQKVADAMAAQDAGLNATALAAFTTFADGGAVADTSMQQALADETGLLEQDTSGGYRLSKAGRAFQRALDHGDVRGALDALSQALDRLQQEQDMGKQDAPADTGQGTPAGKSVSLDQANDDEDTHPGAMIAFLLDEASQQALIDACGELEVDPDHLTLVYLAPDAAELDEQKNALIVQLAGLASCTPTITGRVNGYGRFGGDEDDDTSALYANFDSPALPSFRELLMQCVGMCGIAPITNHGFTPHITLTFLSIDDDTPTLSLPDLAIAFDRIALVWADEVLTFPLCGGAVEVADADSSEAQLIAAEGEVPALAPTGEIKMLGDYRLRIRGVVYGGHDLVGDEFIKTTDVGAGRSFTGMPVYYDHAQRGIKSQIGQVVGVEFADDGIDFEIELDRHKRYVQHVLRLEQQKALGGSTGALPHLVVREGGTLKRWIIGEISLTPTACEPRTHKDITPHIKTTPQALTREAGPEAGGEPAATGDAWRGGAPAIIKTTSKENNVDKDELKAMLAELLKGQSSGIEAKMQAISDAVDARLKAFEDSPALKSSGFISMDGGSADKDVKSFADWLLAVRRSDTKRLQSVYKSAYTDFSGDGVAIKDLNEGSGSAGGYLVPTEYEPMLQRVSAEAAIVEPRARQIRMGSAIRKVPMLKQTANPSATPGSSAFFGGMTFTWEPEAADVSGDKSEPVFEMVEFIARKMVGLTVSSNELTEDAPALEAELTQLFGEGLAHAKDYFYLRGNGVGRPLGILNAPARYELTRHATGNNVEIEDVSGMLARMIPSGLASAIWLLHPLNIADIIQLKIGDTPVFQPDAKGPIAGTLLGRPIAFSEFLPAPGTKGDAMLCSFPFYGAGIRRGIAIAMSEHARFDSDQITWRITYRGDGKPLLDSTIKLADGSNTEVSPFVILN